MTWAELLGLQAAFAVGMAWAIISDSRRKHAMKDRIDKAVGIIRGYCVKVPHCDVCRYTKTGECPLQSQAPCDWDPEKWRQEREAHK